MPGNGSSDLKLCSLGQAVQVHGVYEGRNRSEGQRASVMGSSCDRKTRE